MYYFIRKVEKYYYLFRRIYEIVTKKHYKLSNEHQLQIAIKAINNTIKLNRLILILLIFEAYFKIIKLDFLNPSIK